MGRGAMTVVVDPQRLREALALRGWSGNDLARVSGLSAPTVSAALAGRPITAHSLRCMAVALEREPAVGLISSLIGRDRNERGLGQ